MKISFFPPPAVSFSVIRCFIFTELARKFSDYTLEALDLSHEFAMCGTGIHIFTLPLDERKVEKKGQEKRKILLNFSFCGGKEKICFAWNFLFTLLVGNEYI